MRLFRLVWKLLPWILLTFVLVVLYFTGHWPFGKSGKTNVINTNTVVQEIENIGNLELVKYHFSEVLDFNRLSNAKLSGNAILGNFDFDPDLKAVMIASGEAAGCIDLTAIDSSDIQPLGDTLIITLPQPQLCYYKLALDKTKIHSFTRKGWWSRLFPNDDDEKETFELAYQNAEKQIKEAALQSGILEKTRDNAELILKPMLHKITGKHVVLHYQMAGATLDRKP